MASGYYDFSGAFGNLNSSIDGLRKRWDQNEQKRTLAELGQQVQAGNFDGAAQKAFYLGDAGTGLGILKLGQAAKQQALQQEASRSFMSGLGGGAAANPAISGIGQQAGGGAPSPGGGGPIASAPFTSEAQSSGLHVTSAYRGPDHPLTRANPNSPHAQGMAWDLRARTPEEANATISKQRELLTARGLVEGRDYRIIDEVRNPTRHATGPHIHVQLTPEGKARHGAGAGQQAAPVQVAQAPGGPQADMPAQGASPAQGFAIPQGANPGLPPNDPAPRFSNQALMEAQANPNLPQAQREMAKSILERRLRYSDENSPLKTETLRLQNEKARRDLQGEGAVPLTAEERKQFGISESQAAYKTRNGEIKFGPAGTTINNTNAFDAKGESKFNEALGTAQAKRWNGYIEEGDVARGRLADIQTLRETSRRLGSQGSQANLKAMIGPYAESLGIQIDGLSDIQLYESITNRLAPQLRAPGSGSTSDIEFKGFMRAIGPLSNTPAAREMILDTFEAASRNDIARSEIASRLASGEINRAQAEKEIRALPNPLDGFREFRKQNPDLVGQAIKEAGMRNSAEKRDPVKVASPEEARKLPSGTRIILPDGRPGQVP